MTQETTTEKSENVMKVYNKTSLISLLLNGTIVTESIYLISDYWSSYLKAASNFANTNLDFFNTTILPQLSSGYNTIVNNPITSSLVTVGAGVGIMLSNSLRNITYGNVEKMGYNYGEVKIQNVFRVSRYATIPTAIIAGIYSTISGTTQSWSLFNSEILKNTPQVLENYSALFTTMGIGAIIYCAEPITKNVVNLGRGIYEKGVMVKEIFKDLFVSEKVVASSNSNPTGTENKTESENSNVESTTKVKSDQVKFFERLVKVKSKFNMDKKKTNKK